MRHRSWPSYLCSGRVAAVMISLSRCRSARMTGHPVRSEPAGWTCPRANAHALVSLGTTVTSGTSGTDPGCAPGGTTGGSEIVNPGRAGASRLLPRQRQNAHAVSLGNSSIARTFRPPGLPATRKARQRKPRECHRSVSSHPRSATEVLRFEASVAGPSPLLASLRERLLAELHELHELLLRE